MSLGLEKHHAENQQFRKENEVLLGAKQAKLRESFMGRIIVISIFAIAVFGMTMVVDQTLFKGVSYYVSVLSSVSLLYILFRVVISFFYRPVREEPLEGYKVSVIIPNFNEGVESVKKSIDCLINQDYPIHEIIFIDDGSEDDSGYQEVLRISEEFNSYSEVAATLENGVEASYTRHLPKIIAHKFEKNQGKRAAQTWGFKKSTGDIIFIVDSDGYIYSDALRELLKPLRDPKVSSVVGHILPRNSKNTIMTRLQDVLYTSAFRIGRAAQSVTGTVLVCSGALSVHRKNIIMKNLDFFTSAKLLGVENEAGDDRCLTMFALQDGYKTKYQSTALCITDVPERAKNFFKQQVRWNKSFYVYTIYTLKFAWKRPAMLFWTLGEGFMWIIFAVTKIYEIFNGTTLPIWLMLLYSATYLILAAMMSGAYYIFRNPLVFLITPFLSLIHMLILFPVRIYALLTLKKSGWGTR